MGESEALELIQETLAQELSRVLQIQDYRLIDPNKGFFDLGLDSLMALEYKNRLQRQLGSDCSLTTSVFFENQNIMQLSLFILNHFCIVENSLPDDVINRTQKEMVYFDPKEAIQKLDELTSISRHRIFMGSQAEKTTLTLLYSYLYKPINKGVFYNSAYRRAKSFLGESYTHKICKSVSSDLLAHERAYENIIRGLGSKSSIKESGVKNKSSIGKRLINIFKEGITDSYLAHNQESIRKLLSHPKSIIVFLHSIDNFSNLLLLSRVLRQLNAPIDTILSEKMISDFNQEGQSFNFLSSNSHQIIDTLESGKSIFIAPDIEGANVES